MRRAWVLGAVIWLAGCECEGEPREAVTHESESERPSESESESESAGVSRRACGFDGGVRDLGPVVGRAISVARGDGGLPLVLAERDATHVDAILVGDAITRATFELPDAPALFALEAATADHFVALTLGNCTSDAHATPCVHALGIDTSSGQPVAHGLRTLLLPGALRSSRVTAASDCLYFAHTHPRAAPALDRLTFTADDLSLVTQPLGQGDPQLAEEATEILGITASGGGYAVLWRRGASEDAASSVVLTTQLDEHQVAALHDALVVESMAWLAGSLSIVVSLEFARPTYVRLGADGEMRSPGMTLRFGEEPPAPFGGRRVALVRGEPGTLRIQIRDGAGDDVGEALALDPAAQRADTARSEHGFDALTNEGAGSDRTLALRTVVCP